MHAYDQNPFPVFRLGVPDVAGWIRGTRWRAWVVLQRLRTAWRVLRGDWAAVPVEPHHQYGLWQARAVEGGGTSTTPPPGRQVEVQVHIEPVEPPAAFNRWHLEEAFELGRREGRRR